MRQTLISLGELLFMQSRLRFVSVFDRKCKFANA